MKMRPFICLPLLLWPALAAAQTDDATPPPDPQVGPLPAYASLTKIYVYPPEKPEPPPATPPDPQFAAFLKAGSAKVIRLDTVKTDDVRLDTKHYDDGSVQQTFRKGDITFITNSAYPDSIRALGPWSPDIHAFGNSQTGDFPELDWVNAAAYQGKSEDDGHKVYLYKQGDQTAEIDIASRLPLHAKTTEFEVTYTYNAPPTQKMSLPEKFVQKLIEIQKGWSGAPTGPPPTPLKIAN
jgi:hypothetical protein